MINVLMSRGILGTPPMVEALHGIIKNNHKVAILLYSFFDKDFSDEESYQTYYENGGEYYLKIIESFAPYGIGEDQLLWINYYKDDIKAAKDKINQADILYFPGGSPDQMMKRIIEKDLKETIEMHQKIYIGSSAGAMVQFQMYHISKDKDYQAFSYKEGLDLLHGFSIEVHYRRRKKQKSALRKVFRAYRHPIFTIPDDGALIVDQEGITFIETADILYDDRGIL
ncbi:MAG: hypothetical protein C4537_01845 [Acholeplasma sp.]|jgi:peptidase E|nr:MAG: hypothetical protein C4537_01845 [Acholeplasma sp.]